MVTMIGPEGAGRINGAWGDSKNREAVDQASVKDCVTLVALQPRGV